MNPFCGRLNAIASSADSSINGSDRIDFLKLLGIPPNVSPIGLFAPLAAFGDMAGMETIGASRAYRRIALDVTCYWTDSLYGEFRLGV